MVKRARRGRDSLLLLATVVVLLSTTTLVGMLVWYLVAGVDLTEDQGCIDSGQMSENCGEVGWTLPTPGRVLMLIVVVLSVLSGITATGVAVWLTRARRRVAEPWRR